MINRIVRATLLLAVVLWSALAVAQDWPMAKPIRIVIAFGPGSASDIFARLIGEQLSKALGQAVIVDTKPGASGQIAAEYVARQRADGYTLFLTTNTTHSANPYLFKKLNYDPVKDFTPVMRIGYFPFVVLVDSKLPVHTIKELIDYAKAKSNSAGYAYTSSAGQIAAAALNNATGMGAVAVAYKSAPEAITSVVGGQTTFTVLDFATSLPLTKAGRLRPLAVTSPTRTNLTPTLPTMVEAAGLPDLSLVAWLGLFGPANMPPPIVERLNAELLKILSPNEMQERIFAMGADPAPAGPEEFGRFVRSELAVWERQVRLAGLEPQ